MKKDTGISPVPLSTFILNYSSPVSRISHAYSLLFTAFSIVALQAGKVKPGAYFTFRGILDIFLLVF